MRKLTAEIHWFAQFVTSITTSKEWHAINYMHSKQVNESVMYSDTEKVLWAVENLEPVSEKYEEFLNNVTANTSA
jgi:hypothetical protein